MSLSSAGKLTRAGKETNTVTQFAPENHLFGHSGAWQCPTLGERLRKTSAWMASGGTDVALEDASRDGLMTWERCLL